MNTVKHSLGHNVQLSSEAMASEAEENIITDIGYNVVEDNEKMGENSFDYVFMCQVYQKHGPLCDQKQ